MLGSAPLVAFLAVADLDRSGRFYGGVLGLTLRDERPFAVVADAGGTELRLTLVEAPTAAPWTVLGWKVPDLDSAVDVLGARHVAFTRYAGMGQDERGIWTAPSGARVAWFADPDGNVLSLTQPAAD